MSVNLFEEFSFRYWPTTRIIFFFRSHPPSTFSPISSISSFSSYSASSSLSIPSCWIRRKPDECISCFHHATLAFDRPTFGPSGRICFNRLIGSHRIVARSTRLSDGQRIEKRRVAREQEKRLHSVQSFTDFFLKTSGTRWKTSFTSPRYFQF